MLWAIPFDAARDGMSLPALGHSEGGIPPLRTLQVERCQPYRVKIRERDLTVS
jgi:hypothetical protein